MTIDEIAGGKFKSGNTVYEMVEAKYNGVVVWPSSQPSVTTYRILNHRYTYSNGGSILLASGRNYVTAWGTVAIYENGVDTGERINNASLSISLPSGSSQYFYVSGTRLYGYNLEDNDNTGEDSVTPILNYSGASITGATVYQQINQESTRTVTGTKVYDSSSTEQRYVDYNLIFSSNAFDSAHKCSPAGGSTTLTFQAWHYYQEWQDWTRTDTIVHSFTSGYSYNTSNTVTSHDSGQSKDMTTNEYVNDVTYGNATISGSATGFVRSGTYGAGVEVKSYLDVSQGWDTGRSVTYYATQTKHDGTTSRLSVTLYQAADSIESTVPVTTREWTSQPHTDYSEYAASITISNYDYVCSASHPASAGRTQNIGFYVTGSHREVETRNYVDTTVTTNYWVSGRTTYGGSSTTSGVATLRDETVSDTLTPSFTYETGHWDGTNGWLIRNASNSTLTIESEGTTQYTNASTYGRRGKITVTNGTASQELYVYQARNTATLEYGYNLSIAIEGDRTIPASQTQIGVSYTCQERTRNTYTSGSSTAWSSYAAVTPTISTVPSGLTIRNLTSSAFTVELGTYTTQADRQITVTISRGTATPVSDTITQEAYVPSVQNVATFKPQMFTVNTGPYLKGKVYYLFTIDSGSLWYGTLTGVNFCYRVNGGAKQTVQIGSFYIEETSEPTALEPSGVTIPTFSSGTVKSWFEVTGSKGGFDTINASEDYAYTVTF